ncbi:MAG: YiiX/YebB-like N1pC/P60 family cysteine hydrolase [Candidatus Omnitrophota bacterium]|nr:YiiX/YebB-like N1pC/P60 family cysteine hydrolase [Candidatus Omnitrophota bacterium]
MKAGDILLFKAEKMFSASWWIAWGTNSKYSHVAICVSPDMDLAIEAINGSGVRARNIRKIMQEYDVFRVRQENTYNLNGTISYLVDKLNKKYDLKGVIWLGVLKLLAKIGLPLRNAANNWQIKRDYFCSELCYEAFYRGGNLDIVPEVPEAAITSPGDIAKSSNLEQVEKAHKSQQLQA